MNLRAQLRGSGGSGGPQGFRGGGWWEKADEGSGVEALIMDSTHFTGIFQTSRGNSYTNIYLTTNININVKK